MRTRYLGIATLCMLCVSGLFVLHEFRDKVALVILPSEDTPYPIFSVITQQGINLLRSYGFLIMTCGTSPIPRIKAQQVVVLYAGHGISDFAMLQMRSGEQIPLESVLARITATQMLLLTSACYGGNWLTHANAGRIIISAVNDTEGYIRFWRSSEKYLDPVTPTIARVLELCKERSIEIAFEIWMQQLVKHYTSFQLPYTPVMFDGIEGDTYLT